MHLRMGNHVGATVRRLDEPAPTVVFGHRANAVEWLDYDPPRRAALEAEGRGVALSGQQGHRRVTPAEAGALQSFPPAYPWQGGLSVQCAQVANAVPPILAAVILRAAGATPGAAVLDAVDLFAGPGGWEEGAKALGLTRIVGVEWDHSACRTAVAAGHLRVRADVSSLPLHPFVGVPGLIASPPCPTFSAAGKGSGRHDLPLLLEAIRRLGAGEWPAEQIATCQDERTTLTLEPLRWALYLRPEWIAWEQVPAVLPVWEACAVVLREHGYSVATGNLQAEQYGVPQTRRRAVLVANRTREVALPAPTHTLYRKGKPRQADGLLPWVSMADALDIDSERVLQPGSWADGRGGNHRQYELAEPAPTVALGNDGAGWRWVHERPATTVQGDPRVWPPGHKVNADDRRRLPDADARYGDRAGTDAVRLAPDEAGVLQSFRADYPWQGAITKRRQCIGNAVPPLLARAVLQAAGAADHLTRQETP